MSGITTCPRCQADVSAARFTERGLVCPHCNNPLANIAGLSAPDVDTDVRLGPGAATVVLLVLIAANVAGIAYLFFATRDQIGIALCSMPLFGLLDILVTAAVLPPLWRRYSRRLRGSSPNEVVSGCGLLLLVIVVFVAVCIVFFAACRGLLALKGIS